LAESRQSAIISREFKYEFKGATVKDKIGVSVQNSGNLQILKIQGFMDMTQVHEFESALDGLLSEGKTKIVLDFSELEYISSAGLGALVGRIREVRKNNGDIKIGGGTPAVMEILKMFGFSEVFSLSPTVGDAVKLFGEK
jgi:anti-sigma B factor antagonist